MTKNSLSDILHSMLNKFGKVSHLGIIGHIIIKLSQFHMSEILHLMCQLLEIQINDMSSKPQVYMAQMQ